MVVWKSYLKESSDPVRELEAEERSELGDLVRKLRNQSMHLSRKTAHHWGGSRYDSSNQRPFFLCLPRNDC